MPSRRHVNPPPAPDAVPMQRFGGRVVVVTGAGSGIGAATAERFAREGATVVLAGDHVGKLEAVAATLPEGRAFVQRCDVSRWADVRRLVDGAVRRHGALHVMVNNAGIAPEGSVTELPLEVWERTLAVNAGGVFHGSRAAIPHLRQTRGSIVNTASVSGLGGDWGLSFYNASKGAIVNFTRALALDHGRAGIRVNCVCPSFTKTPMTEDMQRRPALVRKFVERIPLGRPCEAHEVAAVIAFLASDDASFVTGVAMPVDGGVTASSGQPDMG